MARFDPTTIPKRISDRIFGLPYRLDNVGKSGSTILLFDDMVLKIEKKSSSSENEKALLRWLEDKLHVPKIIEAEIQNDDSYLLMSKISGEMACSDNCFQDMEKTVKALAKGLKMLWKIDITDCPCSNAVSEKMKQARYNIDNGLVDTDDFNPETFNGEGFKDIPDLYDFLDANRPKEDLVFSHGDFCPQNIFVSGCDLTGFIDWGRGGIADRWQDIALCVRSLRHDFIECDGYGENEYLRHKALLFQELGMEPDEEKIRYYTLLDELF